MNEQKMREQFEAWAAESGDCFSLTKGNCGWYLSERTAASWKAWQAATAATQRDAMAVAEAVRRQYAPCCRECSPWDGVGEWKPAAFSVAWSDRETQVCEEHLADAKATAANDGADSDDDPIIQPIRQIDLAAIVEAVQHGQREAVNQQMLTALKEFVEFLDGGCNACTIWCNPDRYPCHSCNRVERKASEDLRRPYEFFTKGQDAIAAAEAAQPASAQQQGEPVAWFKTSGSLKSLCFDSDPTIRLGADSEVKADSVRPLIFADAAPPATACSVPDGYALVPVEATDAMIEAAWDSDGTDYVGEHKRIWRFGLAYKAAIAAAPKPEGGA